MLFRSSLVALSRTLERRPWLADAVHQLDLGEWTARAIAEAAIDRRQISALAIALLRQCRQLRRLQWPAVTWRMKPDLELAIVDKAHSLRSIVYGDARAERDPWISQSPDPPSAR